MNHEIEFQLLDERHSVLHVDSESGDLASVVVDSADIIETLDDDSLKFIERYIASGDWYNG